ncbi:hypothetical protein KT99_17241 [Shewanella benthica KT99]|uniref:Uncharacterized protein n=2 Tax=Shewanella benthica TaxID=43661 RepID=A9D5T8_9GAMM|nr:hypothetical protein KT99_17241 [Shewanella benthica KT99]
MAVSIGMQASPQIIEPMKSLYSDRSGRTSTRRIRCCNRFYLGTFISTFNFIGELIGPVTACITYYGTDNAEQDLFGHIADPSFFAKATWIF